MTLQKGKLPEKKSKRVLNKNRKKDSDCPVIQTPTRIKRSRISDMRSTKKQLRILTDFESDRLIHVAVANEDIKIVQKVCEMMAKNSLSFDIQNSLRQTPLHLAVMLGNIDIAALLMCFGASPLLCDRKGNTVLHLAVKSGSRSVLSALLLNDQVKSILNAVDHEGYSALHYAVFNNNESVVQILHDYGADMNKTDGKSGRTCLIHAVLEQNLKMVELLLRCSSCPKKIDYSGRSAIDMALQTGNPNLIELLQDWLPYNDDTSSNKEQIRPLQSSQHKM